jgi:hypothetical protein
MESHDSPEVEKKEFNDENGDPPVRSYTYFSSAVAYLDISAMAISDAYT